MPVDVIQPSSMLGQKRARESITLSDDSVSKCGELFVTNCADKWTFYCTYCQKATTDIGVFICHIRLEHLYEQQDLQQSEQTPSAPASNVSTLQNDIDRSLLSRHTNRMFSTQRRTSRQHRTAAANGKSYS